MIKHLVMGVFAFVLAFGIAASTVASVFAAADLNFRWYGSAIVENRNTSFGTAISSAVTEYNNTDLTVSYSASGSNILYYQADYGNVGWLGNAQPEANNNGWKLCYDWNGNWTGSCDTFWHRATHAWIYLNTNGNQLGGNATLATTVVKHELGHVWGLAHVPCSVWSIMEGGPCFPSMPSTIQNDEITWINNNY